MTEPVDLAEKLRAENETLRAANQGQDAIQLRLREQGIQLRAALDSMVRNFGEDALPGVRALSLANARIVLEETATPGYRTVYSVHTPGYVGTSTPPTAGDLAAEAELEAQEAAFWEDYYEFDEHEGGAA